MLIAKIRNLLYRNLFLRIYTICNDIAGAEKAGAISNKIPLDRCTELIQAIGAGASFDKDQKSINHDAHNSPANLEHRGFWLGDEKEAEIQQYLWFQIEIKTVGGEYAPATDGCPPGALPALAYLKKSLDSGDAKTKAEAGHNVHLYSAGGKTMVEVHVDFISLSARAALGKNGGKRSVRYATGRMYRKSGMDECAYSSHDGNPKACARTAI